LIVKYLALKNAFFFKPLLLFFIYIFFSFSFWRVKGGLFLFLFCRVPAQKKNKKRKDFLKTKIKPLFIRRNIKLLIFKKNEKKNLKITVISKIFPRNSGKIFVRPPKRKNCFSEPAPAPPLLPNLIRPPENFFTLAQKKELQTKANIICIFRFFFIFFSFFHHFFLKTATHLFLYWCPVPAFFPGPTGLLSALVIQAPPARTLKPLRFLRC